MNSSKKVKGLRSLIFGRFDTETQFAEALGWPRQRLNKITNGAKVPDVNELNDLAKGLECTVDEMAKIFLTE